MNSADLMQRPGALDAYLREPRYVPSSHLRGLLAPLIPRTFRPKARIWATDCVRPIARRRARRLESRTPLRLHLGSGRGRKSDWVNIDLVGDEADLSWNLIRPLPFRSASADAIFHEHLLEHFDFCSALRLCEECHRVLKPGATIRIVVPDAEYYFEHYRQGDLTPAHDLTAPRPTALLAAQEIFFCFGHRSAYDFETLRLLLHTVGFRDVRRSAFREGTLGSLTDSAHRRLGSLYCEAVR